MLLPPLPVQQPSSSSFSSDGMRIMTARFPQSAGLGGYEPFNGSPYQVQPVTTNFIVH